MSTWARILITLLCMSTFARWREKRSLLHNPRYFAKWMSRFPGAEMNASPPQRIVSDVHLSKAQKVEHCVDITTISCMPSSSQHLSYNLGLNWFKVYCFDVSWWRVQLIARQPVHLFFVCVEIRWWCVGFCWNRWVRGFFFNCCCCAPVLYIELALTRPDNINLWNEYEMCDSGHNSAEVILSMTFSTILI